MTTTEPLVRGRPPSLAAPRLLASWHRTGRFDLKGHLDTHGSLTIPLRSAGDWAHGFVEDVRAAGLTGRGGAGFPTARKLDSIRGNRRLPLLVVNVMEGEPASQKDRVLMACAPHLVLDGAELVARAIRATEIAVCVADDRFDSAERIRSALVERTGAGVGRTRARVVQPPGRYVTGDESALVHWLAGGPAYPQFRASKSTPLSIKRQPVLVQSAETLAHVALIARYGPEWFRTAGLPEAPGTCLVTLSGPLANPGVCEVELGTPIASVLERAGIDRPIGAVLVGGFGGTWLRSGSLGTPFAPGPLAAIGGSMGAGVLAAIPATSCGIGETARIARYMAGESAGQCGPCTFGLPAIAQDLSQIARGEGDRNIVNRLRMRLGAVEGRGACRHPDGVVRLVRSALEVFSADVADHVRRRPCPGSNRPPNVLVPPPAVGPSRT